MKYLKSFALGALFILSTQAIATDELITMPEYDCRPVEGEVSREKFLEYLRQAGISVNAPSADSHRIKIMNVSDSISINVIGGEQGITGLSKIFEDGKISVNVGDNVALNLNTCQPK